MTNTVEIARMCTARRSAARSHPDLLQAQQGAPRPDRPRRGAAHRPLLLETGSARWIRLKRHTEQDYLERFEREMAADLQGLLRLLPDRLGLRQVGQGQRLPGRALPRGSGGGSLVAYLADHRRDGPGRVGPDLRAVPDRGPHSLPDFDIDFPTSWRGRVLAYLRERWGADYVSNIGTVSRLRSKAAINDVHRVLEAGAAVRGATSRRSRR
jgi:hypothetical protein